MAPVVVRERLIRMLDQAFDRALDWSPGPQLTQVVGPVGAGKSSLVASWAADRDVVWLRAGQHHRLLEQVMDHHGVPPSPDDDAAVSALRQLPVDTTPVVVVVDDAQSAAVGLMDVVSRLLVEAPLVARFVIVSRDESLLPARLLDVGLSTVTVRGRDLRFTDEEAEALVLSLAPTVTDPDLARIVMDGRGWAAALVLGARAAGTHASPDAGQLGARVLSSVPDRVRALLLATCDEEVLDARTAVALTGDSSAAALIEELAADGLLVDHAHVGTGRGQLFLVHPGLRRALQHGSRGRVPGPETPARVHVRAATALVRSYSDLADAVRQAILAEEPQVLLHVLRDHGHVLLEPDRQQLLGVALDALPPDVRASDSSVLVLESMLCRLTRRYDEAAALSVSAEQAAQASGPGRDDADEVALDSMALMRLWRSRCGWADPHLAVADARLRLGCQHRVSRGTHRLTPGRSLALSAWLMGELATVEIRIGDLEEAGLHLRELIFTSRILDHERLLATGLAHRSLLELVDGSFQTAAATARSSLDHTDAVGAQSFPHSALAHLVAGWGALHALDLEACEEHLESAERGGVVEVDVLASELLRLLRARLLAEHGHVEEARRLLAQHRSVDQVVPTFMRRLSAVVEAQSAVMVHDVATVRDRSLMLVEMGYADEAELFGALADAGEGLTERALSRIDALLAQPRVDNPAGAVGAAVRVSLMLRLGDTAGAAERMPDLLARVAPQRLMQILTIGFLGGEGFAQLLAKEARRPDGHPFALEAMARLSRYVSLPGQRPPRVQPIAQALEAVAAEVVRPDGQDGIGSLTAREREVLVELSRGGSYSDVAQALFVSENTVKTHLSSVYRKLGVDRRGDALRVAREHDLV